MASSHRVWGAAPHVGQRTFRASVSTILPVILPILLMWQVVKSGQFGTMSNHNAAPSPDAVIP